MQYYSLFSLEEIEIMQQFSSCSVIFRCVDYYNFFSLITSELIYLQALTSFCVSEQDYVVHSKIFDRFAQHLKVFLMFLFTGFSFCYAFSYKSVSTNI